MCIYIYIHTYIHVYIYIYTYIYMGLGFTCLLLMSNMLTIMSSRICSNVSVFTIVDNVVMLCCHVLHVYY